MLLRSTQRTHEAGQLEPNTEAEEQVETLAEDLMGIDESEGDLPLPLYLAGEAPQQDALLMLCLCTA